MRTHDLATDDLGFELRSAERTALLEPNAAENDWNALHGCGNDSEHRWSECGSRITGAGIGSQASFLSRMMNKARLCFGCFGVRDGAQC